MLYITGFQERISIKKLVPLETNDSSLLGIISQVVVSGQNLFILDGLQNAVLRYDMNGNFIGKINHQGQGPQEYIRARSIAVANDKLYVSDLTRILQYDLDGRYLNTFHLEDQSEKAYQLMLPKVIPKPVNIIPQSIARNYVR
jgi:hypothetical protein